MKNLLKYPFEFIQEICPERNPDGNIAEYYPEKLYFSHDKAALNKYGNGPFCRFSIDSNWNGVCGVYAFYIDDELVYIGKTENFGQRFNLGYGQISPRNCFLNGQVTNCKINKVVLNAVKKSQKIELYFYPTNEYSFVESELINYYSPKYNGVHPSVSALSHDEKPIKSKQVPHTPTKNPLIAEVRKYIESLLREEKLTGKKDVTLKSGDIHSSLHMVNAMPTVCNAMRSLNISFKYEVVQEPPKGNGSRLFIKYFLD